MFSPNAVREEFFAVTSILRLRQKSVKGLGELEYIFMRHKNMNVLLFSQNNITYYITINSKTNLTSILINKIKKLITES